jgi:uncharacterized protein YyaL (SSP411 family)
LYHIEGVEALLDDYVYLIDALLTAYEATGKSSYMEAGATFMKECIDRLWDSEEGGFMDSRDNVLGVKVRGIQDVPHPSANSLAILLLLKLSAMTGQGGYYLHAEKALKTFAPMVKDMGVHAGFYYSALDAFFNGVKLELHSKADSELAQAARTVFAPYTSIRYGDEAGHALVCFREACHEPLRSGKDLQAFIREKKYLEKV